MNPKQIEINIGELILDGFPSGDEERIRISMEQELAGLLTEQGAPELVAQSTNISRLRGGLIRIEPNAKRGTEGKQIARAVFGAMKR